jgi:hypothetical protein
MKKSLLTIIPALAVVALSFTSCAEDRCCRKAGVPDVCESEIGGAGSYDAVLLLNQANGYTCD